MSYYDMMGFEDTEVTKGKKAGKFRFQKKQGMISIDDDTEITLPNYF
jgi:hypothetical protein